MFVMFFNVVFSMFVCYSAAFCQLCFYNKDWIGTTAGTVCSKSLPSLNPLTSTVAIWIQLQSILCQTVLSRHFWYPDTLTLTS